MVKATSPSDGDGKDDEERLSQLDLLRGCENLSRDCLEASDWKAHPRQARSDLDVLVKETRWIVC